MKLMKSYGRLILITSFILSLLPITHPAAAQSITTLAVYQPFEHGLMIWREDTGEIWVLVESSWQAGWFAEASYADLPDNPVADTPPSGLLSPTNGFGRIWGNHPSFRYQLGWATEPEVSYTAEFAPAPPTAGGLPQLFRVNLPDGRFVFMHSDLTWQYPGPRPIPSLPATTIFPAAYQQFENGFMLYWSETGSIWVLEDSGRSHLFVSGDYGALSDNPVTEAAPAGKMNPILGFGKVWGHFPEVRQALGWAVQPEQGYLMSFVRIVSFGSINGSALGFVVSMPDGRRLILRDNSTWHFSS
jgi:hypothetical protein